MKKIYLISTVGISLLRNSLPGDEGAGLFKVANQQEADLCTDELDLIRRAEGAARKALAAANRAGQKRLSAELNAILSYEDEFGQKPVVHHELLVTDTYTGQLAASILSDFLQNKKISAQPWVIKDLRTARGDELRAALSGLVPELVQRIENADESGWDVVFNLTGGFKGVNGFLQTAAMLWATETIYLFEGSQELMHIPRLPIGIDTSGMMEQNFSLFRQMADGKAIPLEDVRKAGIPGSLLFENEGVAILSEWGQLIWEKTYQQIASSHLLDPAHEKISFTEGFRRPVKGLAPERMRLVNRAIARLGKLLDGKPEGDLNTLDFHPIKGKSHAPSTHQIDAWSDQDARRIYMHKEGDRWLIDKLDAHL